MLRRAGPLFFGDTNAFKLNSIEKVYNKSIFIHSKYIADKVDVFFSLQTLECG